MIYLLLISRTFIINLIRIEEELISDKDKWTTITKKTITIRMLLRMILKCLKNKLCMIMDMLLINMLKKEFIKINIILTKKSIIIIKTTILDISIQNERYYV